jgi:hypothetical protein
VLRRLSGGNQQKVAIGKWLRNDASVLIFDEPTKGVDESQNRSVQLIDGLAREGQRGDLCLGRICRAGRAVRPHLRAVGRAHRGGNRRGRGPGRDTTLYSTGGTAREQGPFSNAAASGRQQIFDFLYKWGMLLTVVALVAVFGLASDNFLDPNNIINILRSIAIVTVIAIGVSISLTIGGFDLSVDPPHRWPTRW